MNLDKDSLFILPSELGQFQQQLRRFVETELVPLEKHVRADGSLPEHIHAQAASKAKSAGFWLVDVPEELGGQGFSLLALAVFWEEISRTTAVAARDHSIFGPTVGPILLAARGEQRDHYLMPVLRGEAKVCFAQTEPDAGSDPARMRTQAVQQPDGSFLLNGVKRFITGADKATFAQVIAVTNRRENARNEFSCFIVDMKTNGVKITSRQMTMMGESPCEIVFDNVRVPSENIVGNRGDGFRLGQAWLTQGRIRHGARGVGVASRCLELASAYAKQRSTFGAPLAERQGIQWMLADSFIEIHSARLMVQHAAAKIDRGEDARSEAFAVKIFGDEMGFRVADRSLQIHGGMGLTTDLPIERFWRDQRSFIITEGPTEVLRTALANRILADEAH